MVFQVKVPGIDFFFYFCCENNTFLSFHFILLQDSVKIIDWKLGSLLNNLYFLSKALKLFKHKGNQSFLYLHDFDKK